MQRIVTAALILSGLIHLLPLPGILGAAQLERLYGLSIDDPNLSLLMRHRAVLFGLLGTLLVIAAFNPPLRPIAYGAGLVSTISFLLLALMSVDLNTMLRRVVAVDILAVACLLLAAGIDLYSRASNTDL